MPHMLPVILKSKIDAARAVSFDVFDTLIFRPVAEPHHLFRLLQTAAQQILADPVLPFYDVRRQAELEMRAHARNKMGLEEITYDQLYARVAALLHVASDDRRLERIKNLEMETELSLCFTLASRKAIYDYAREKNKIILITSDMYMPCEWLEKLLHKCGYTEYHHLLLSSETGKTKHYGSAFDLMLETLKLPAQNVVHVGDNPRADIHPAQQRGIVTHHIPKPLELFFQHPRNRQMFGTLPYHSDIQVSAMVAAWAHRYADRFYTNEQVMPDSIVTLSWQDFGFYLAGSIYLGFTQWLIRQAKTHDIKHLLFLARDGQILEQVYSVLAPLYKAKATPHYVYASRRALMLSRIAEPLDTLAYEYLCSTGISLSVRDYITRLDYTLPHAEEVAHAVGFASLDECVTTSAHQKQLVQLFRQLAPAISKQAAAERAAAQAYYRALPLGQGKAAMVDIGWSGNTQLAMHEVLPHLPQPLMAFFLGSHAQIRRVEEAGLYSDSYMYHAGQPAMMMDQARQCLEILELLFTANHGSVKKFRMVGKAAEPVLDDIDDSPERQQAVAGIHAGAMEFIKALDPVLRHLVNTAPIMAADAARPLFTLLNTPVAKEVILFEGIVHIQTFGQSDLSRSIAPKLSGKPLQWLNPWFFAQEFQRAYWKTGFMCRLNSVQRLYLKMLLWTYLNQHHVMHRLRRIKMRLGATKLASTLRQWRIKEDNA